MLYGVTTETQRNRGIVMSENAAYGLLLSVDSNKAHMHMKLSHLSIIIMSNASIHYYVVLSTFNDSVCTEK